MTRNSDQREWHENGRPSAAAGRKLPVTMSHGSSGSAQGPPPQGPYHDPSEALSRPVLESLCRTVTELAAATAKTPTRIKLQQGETTVEVEWPDSAAEGGPPHPGTEASHGEQDMRPADGAEQDATHYVCAPTVGTFYHAAAPEAPPFVSVGDLVRPGQPVGILEVMKMMSTIESDTAGRVVEVLVPDGQPVEFQERLVAVEPGPIDEPDEQ